MVQCDVGVCKCACRISLLRRLHCSHHDSQHQQCMQGGTARAPAAARRTAGEAQLAHKLAGALAFEKSIVRSTCISPPSTSRLKKLMCDTPSRSSTNLQLAIPARPSLLTRLASICSVTNAGGPQAVGRTQASTAAAAHGCMQLALPRRTLPRPRRCSPQGYAADQGQLVRLLVAVPAVPVCRRHVLIDSPCTRISSPSGNALISKLQPDAQEDNEYRLNKCRH